MTYKFTMDELEMKIERGTATVYYLSEIYRRESAKTDKASRLNAQVVLIHTVNKFGVCLTK